MMLTAAHNHILTNVTCSFLTFADKLLLFTLKVGLDICSQGRKVFHECNLLSADTAFCNPDSFRSFSSLKMSTLLYEEQAVFFLFFGELNKILDAYKGIQFFDDW